MLKPHVDKRKIGTTRRSCLAAKRYLSTVINQSPEAKLMQLMRCTDIKPVQESVLPALCCALVCAESKQSTLCRMRTVILSPYITITLIFGNVVFASSSAQQVGLQALQRKCCDKP